MTDTLQKIVSDVCARRGVTPADFFSVTVARAVAHARHEVFWRARYEAGASVCKISTTYRRDRKTVKEGIWRHEKRMTSSRYPQLSQIAINQSRE